MYVGDIKDMSTRVQPSQQQQGKTGVSKDSGTLSGKCAYSNCPHEDDGELPVASIKNTEYKLHLDCMDKFAQEMRAEGKNQTQDRIAALDAQHGKTNKESEESQQQAQQTQSRTSSSSRR